MLLFFVPFYGMQFDRAQNLKEKVRLEICGLKQVLDICVIVVRREF